MKRTSLLIGYKIKPGHVIWGLIILAVLAAGLRVAEFKFVSRVIIQADVAIIWLCIANVANNECKGCKDRKAYSIPVALMVVVSSIAALASWKIWW